MAGLLVSISGPDSTIIDGSGQGSVLEITNGNWIVAGFTITNGYGDNQGGGVRVWSGGIMMNQNRFVNNFALSYGGGLVAYNSDVMIDSSIFIGNTSDNLGGGLQITNHDSLTYRMVSISNTIFAENTANQGSGAGAYLGGFDGAYMDVYIDRSGFIQNVGDNYTGLVIRGNVNASVYESSIVGNEAQKYAAGGGFSNGSSVYFERTLISQNRANLSDGN